MSKRDYTKYSKEFKPITPKVEVVEPVAEPVEQVEVEPVPPVTGVVTNCLKLNVRSEPKPTAEALCIVERGSELIVYKDESTEAYYKVCTAAGVEGYCVKFYVKVKP